MHTGKHKRGASRLLSAVAALALILAQLIGAYAHAGHDHAAAHAACAHHGGGSQVAPDEHQPGEAQTEHGSDPATHNHSCDFMCHGGVAILAISTFSYADAQLPYELKGIAFDHLLWPASLERPPKSPVRA
jgi:hypothetical protein